MALRPRRLVSALTMSVLLAASFVAASPSASNAAAGDGTLDILVLGDSYSAGNGATDDSGQAQTYGPDGCYRSKVNWAEKYAAKLRVQGVKVRVSNHACSGGVTADFTHARLIATKTNNVGPTPAGATTNAAAEAALTTSDPCRTTGATDEEYWTYHATLVIPSGLTTYDCSHYVKPQVDYVTPETDLVLFTMGGNDAGFSSIVQNCFVLGFRTASGCQGKVEAAHTALTDIRQNLLAGIAAVRAHGLRSDAKIVQLGYPWLQTDNDFTLTDPTGTYHAGTEVRSLVTDGDAAIAGIVPTVNASNPGQMSFLDGVPQKFATHEPDASTPTGNSATWINQAFSGPDLNIWYHPNGLGQTAYAELLATHGTFGAPLDPPDTSVVSAPGGPANGLPVTAGALIRVRAPHGINVGQRVRLRVKVRLVDGSRPRGKVTILGLPAGSKIAGKKVKLRDHGVVRIWVKVRSASTTSVRVVYTDRSGATGSKDKAVRAAR